MPANLIQILGFAIAAIAVGIALYYWRRSQGLYSLLVEGANRFEELRQRSSQLEGALGKAEERFREHRETAQKLEKSLAEAREQTNAARQKLEAKEHELKVVSEKLELQKGHLEKQLTRTEEKLRLSEAGREETLAQLQNERSAEASRQNQAKDNFERRLDSERQRSKAAEQQIAQLEKDQKALEHRLKDADPLEMRRIKRKIAQYDRLYASMKGLKEMAEERNQNWEIALRKLSAWILTEEAGHSISEQQLPKELGPLVAKALQKVGAQLIDESEFSTHESHHPDDELDGSDHSPHARLSTASETERLADAADVFSPEGQPNKSVTSETL